MIAKTAINTSINVCHICPLHGCTITIENYALSHHTALENIKLCIVNNKNLIFQVLGKRKLQRTFKSRHNPLRLHPVCRENEFCILLS